MRRRTLLAGALAATPLVAACDSGGGASGSTSSGGGGRTTISYGIWDPAQLAGMQQIVKAFEAKNPDVSVDIQVTPSPRAARRAESQAGLNPRLQKGTT
ncbi:hypothetical protein [Streptomyces sp. NPDC055134]